MKRTVLAIPGILVAMFFCAVELTALVRTVQAAEPPKAASQRPVIEKKGTMGLDLVETTPFVFKDKLYRLEWFRNESVLRIMDHERRRRFRGSVPTIAFLAPMSRATPFTWSAPRRRKDGPATR